MFNRFLSLLFLIFVFSPVFVASFSKSKDVIPTQINDINVPVQVNIAVPIQVIDVLPIVEIVDSSNFSKKEDMTMFYLRHIRPTLPDYNPNYKPVVVRTMPKTIPRQS
jgi:hypothetical protein